MHKYIRDAKEALNIGAGLSGEIRGVLSLLVDLMVIHNNEGIPCEPPSYCAGMIGQGEKKWTHTFMPALVEAHKIRRVNKNGIDVWVWHDKNLMAGGPRAIIDRATGVDNADVGKGDDYKHRGMRLDVAEDVCVLHHGCDDLPNNPAREIKLEDIQLSPAPFLPPSPPPTQETVVDLDEREAEKPVFKDAGPEPAPGRTDPIPYPSAIDLLGRAGVDTANHPHGEFFWARADHKPTIKKWMGHHGNDHDKILMLLYKAVEAGEIDPEAHPNKLEFYDKFVMVE